MTPEQIEIVRTAIATEVHRYDMWTLFALVIGSGIASFIGSYLHSKGTNKAIKEDLDILTAQTAATTKATEAIKAQIGASTWVQQQRWDLKRHLYTDLLSALYKLADEYSYMVKIELAMNTYGAPEYKDTRQRLEREREERAAQIPKLWDEVIRVRGFGELTLARESIGIVDILRTAWRHEGDPNMSFIDELELRQELLRSTHEAIVASARKDMEL